MTRSVHALGGPEALPRRAGEASGDVGGIVGLIRGGRIITHFQPIHSIRSRSILGVEALSRGYDTDSEALIPPMRLSTEARREGVWLDLERLMRVKALESYGRLFAGPNPPLLFLNFDPLVFDEGVAGSGNLANLVASLDLDPAGIVLEIVESHARDEYVLLEFVERHRALGFLIAVDDVGDGDSNLARLAHLKPDILKIDRSVCSGIDRDYHRRKAVQSLTWFAHQVGALALAEGIETRDEALTAMELGADLLQGYYLDRPGANIRLFHADRMHDLLAEFRDRTARRAEIVRKKRSDEKVILMRVVSELGAVRPAEFNAVLARVVVDSDDVECAYVLDPGGIQISHSHVRSSRMHRHNILFHPADAGSDHSMKEYCFMLDRTGAPTHITSPYISGATGELCVTLSARFHAVGGHACILCVDVLPL
jgi:EAL domain-containing protein (putative c-di-GMP-specific phosphodiesterase class I)